MASQADKPPPTVRLHFSGDQSFPGWGSDREKQKMQAQRIWETKKGAGSHSRPRWGGAEVFSVELCSLIPGQWPRLCLAVHSGDDLLGKARDADVLDGVLDALHSQEAGAEGHNITIPLFDQKFKAYLPSTQPPAEGGPCGSLSLSLTYAVDDSTTPAPHQPSLPSDWKGGTLLVRPIHAWNLPYSATSDQDPFFPRCSASFSSTKERSRVVALRPLDGEGAAPEWGAAFGSERVLPFEADRATKD